MAEPGANLNKIVSAFTTMANDGPKNEIRDLFRPDVFWQGLEPDLYCSNRRQVLGFFFRHLGMPPRLTRFEAQEDGDAVVVTFDGPDFQEPGPADIAGARSLRFQFEGGRVKRIDSLGKPA